MTQADLQKVLRAADPAAVLVSSRILERIIREDCQLPNMHWNIPHYKSYVCDRQLLFRHAEQADLELQSDQLLPDTVLVLIRPDAEELSNLERNRLLLKYWRRLFHARIHLVLENKHHEGNLDNQALRERIAAIGRTEFEEIREVLTLDRWILPDASDRAIYVEFAAVYLEMRQFAASLLPSYFPGIRDFGKIEQVLAQDIDAADLFARTRLAGAANPVVSIESRPDDSQEVYWRLVRSAQKSANDGNLVAAAILRTRASRIAPAALTLPTRQEAEKDIAQLTKRLGEALDLSDAEVSDWTRYLTLLLDKADQENRPMEARVLEDLLKVCEDHEKEIYTLDLFEYLMSGGKRPIKRPLPSQRLVRIAKHLRAANQKLGTVRLSDTDRNHLTRLLNQALSKTEEALRTRFRPVLETALSDVGLQPDGPLQQAAFEKIVAELLDRISTYGYLTFAELRDTISRNQLKLADLHEPEDFIRGDPLIRLDRRLGSLLDGVYRPGEFYVRWLERFTSMKFGTWWGRAITLFLTGPLLTAWLVLFLLGVVVEKTDHYLYEAPGLKRLGSVLMGPASGASETPSESIMDVPVLWWHLGLLGAFGVFFLVFFHNAPFRKRCGRALRYLWRGGRFVFWDVPLKFVPLDTFHRLINSWLFRLVYWYLIKPSIVTGVLLLLYPPLRHNLYLTGSCFLLATFLLNSRLGRSTTEGIGDVFVQFMGMVRSGLLIGLFRFFLYLFKQVSEFIEYVLFKVDEWLRYRTGDSQLSLVVRTILGVIWAPIAVLSRFYVVVLFEPGLNPLKLPVTLLAGKVLAPFVPLMYASLFPTLSDYLGTWLARAFLLFHFFWLPDVFGFLFWELKENWNLYRANRGRAIRPAALGGHGETVRGLLQPGFHSGTVPRLFNRLRQAERRAMQTRNWHQARALRHEVDEVAECVHRFVSREMLTILKQSRAWQGQAVTTGTVSLSTNRIRVELEHLDHPALPVEIEIEHHRGWLVAGIATNGWLEALPSERLQVFTACLAYLYKRADIDLVREQIKSGVSGSYSTWQLTETELVGWASADGTPWRLPLRDDPDTGTPSPERDTLIFARTPITWDQWDETWKKDHLGEMVPALAELSNRLILLPVPPSKTTVVNETESVTLGEQAVEDTTNGQETIEPRSEAEGEAGRARTETASPTGIPGLHGEHVQEG
jgi:hypothetical protein